MGLTSFLPPIFSTCGLVAGVYTPISMSFIGKNSPPTTSSSPSPLETTAEAISASARSQQEDYQKLSDKGPILSCKEYGGNYQVYLAVKEGEVNQDWKKESANNLITFEVLDVNNSNKIVWGPKSVEGDKWDNWEVFFDAFGDVKLRIPSEEGNYDLLGYKTIKCQERKINKTFNVTSGEVTVAAEKIHTHNANLLKVEIDEGQCSEEQNSNIKKVECALKLPAGINLNWGSGFSPKAIFQVPVTGK